MKFSVKLILSTITIMSCVLSVSRFIIIRQSFNHSREEAARQNVNQHIAQKYYIESNIINSIKLGKEITNDETIEYIKSLYSYLGDNSEKIALYNENQEVIYSNFEQIDKVKLTDIINKEMDNYYIRKIDNSQYMIFYSYLTINNNDIYIVNIYDVTYVYEERDRQAKEIIFADSIILGIAAIAIVAFGSYLTRPIKKLNDTTKKIARGEFTNRVKIDSKDEIGELANSFNAMSEEIENTIKSLNISIKQKDDFIKGFTHEIKTPMTAIIGYSDMLRLKKCDEELTKKALNYIYSEARRLEKISHKLMELMSITENSIQFESVNIKDFINKVIEKITELDGIEIKTELENARLAFDKSLMEVVIRNLIENAKKAEPKDNIVIIEGAITKERKI